MLTKLLITFLTILVLAAAPAGAAAKKKSAPKPTPAPMASPYIPTTADMTRYADNVCKQRGYDAYYLRANNPQWSHDASAQGALQRVEYECRQYLIMHTRAAMPPMSDIQHVYPSVALPPGTGAGWVDRVLTDRGEIPAGIAVLALVLLLGCGALAWKAHTSSFTKALTIGGIVAATALMAWKGIDTSFLLFLPPVAVADLGRSVLVMVIFLLVLGLYFLPTITANAQRHPQTAAIGILNVFLGWTFLGWVLALVWAFTVHTSQRR